MEEGSGEQHYDTKVLQEDPKDIMARKWTEELRKAEKKPREVVGGLIEKGAKVVNCEATEKMGWNPKVGGEGRRSVYLTGTTYGLHLGAETLRYGLSFMYPTDRSKSLGSDNLFMVPYPKFTQEGRVDPTNSGVFLFNVEQVQDLQKLLGLTPTPLAGK